MLTTFKSVKIGTKGTANLSDEFAKSLTSVDDAVKAGGTKLDDGVSVVFKKAAAGAEPPRFQKMIDMFGEFRVNTKTGSITFLDNTGQPFSQLDDIAKSLPEAKMTKLGLQVKTITKADADDMVKAAVAKGASVDKAEASVKQIVNTFNRSKSMIKLSDEAANLRHAAKVGKLQRAGVVKDVFKAKPEFLKSVDEIGDGSTATVTKAKELNANATDDILKNADAAASNRLVRSMAGGLTDDLAKMGDEIGEGLALTDDQAKLALGKVDELSRLGKINAKAKDLLKRAINIQRSTWLKAGLSVAAITAITYLSVLNATKEIVKETRSGCYVYDQLTTALTRIDLLTCGNAPADPAALTTCVTQSYSPTSGSTTVSSGISSCGEKTFNPCLSTANSRAPASSKLPLVPNVCDKYLYKGTAPPAVTGVTAVNACKTTDQKDLPPEQTCSPYCSTEYFKLPSTQSLICFSPDFVPALLSLAKDAGITPEDVTGVPEDPDPNEDGEADSVPVSKALIISAASLGGLMLVLVAVWLYLKYGR